MNQDAKYLCQRSFSCKVIVGTHAHSGQDRSLYLDHKIVVMIKYVYMSSAGRTSVEVKYSLGHRNSEIICDEAFYSDIRSARHGAARR